MNLEQIKEIRTVFGESEINKLLSTGRWHIISLECDDGSVNATMVRL